MNRRQFLAVGAASTLVSTPKVEAASNPFADRLNAEKVVPSDSWGPHIQPNQPTSWAYGNDTDPHARIGFTFLGFELSDKAESPNKEVMEAQPGDAPSAWADRWAEECSRVTLATMLRHRIRLGHVAFQEGKVIYQLWALDKGGARWDFEQKRWV